jgi:hypothetical protein
MREKTFCRGAAATRRMFKTNHKQLQISPIDFD